MIEESKSTARLAIKLLPKIRPYKIEDYLELARLCRELDGSYDTVVIDDVFINFILLQ
jgi:hypothetical protein